MRDQDHYPFGALLPGRNYSSTTDTYRFGFQGQEKDDEMHGATGTSYNYEFRMHDPRIGRMLSIDPLASKYPFYSPYAFSGNRVIDAVELEGLEPAIVGKNNPFLIILVQGRAAGPAGDRIETNKTQYHNIPKDVQTDGALMTLSSESFDFNPTVVKFSGSDDYTTTNDIYETIKTYRSNNPDGRIAMIGHSSGGRNVIDAALSVATSQEIENKTIDLVVTLESTEVLAGGLRGRHYSRTLGRNVLGSVSYNGQSALGFKMDARGPGGVLSEDRYFRSELGTGVNHQNLDDTITPLLPPPIEPDE